MCAKKRRRKQQQKQGSNETDTTTKCNKKILIIHTKLANSISDHKKRLIQMKGRHSNLFSDCKNHNQTKWKKTSINSKSLHSKLSLHLSPHYQTAVQYNYVGMLACMVISFGYINKLRPSPK